MSKYFTYPGNTSLVAVGELGKMLTVYLRSFFTSFRAKWIKVKKRFSNACHVFRKVAAVQTKAGSILLVDMTIK